MLMTSYNEGFPMTLLEAKANALPIVAYDLPYLETMQPQTGVLTITSGNISGAAMQVINLLQDSDLYRKVSAEGLENALAFSSFDFVEAYQKIMTALFDPIENDLPLYGDLMLRTL